MKVKHVDKHYLYLRDFGTCYFCNREIRFGKMSIDHYLPRSEGGTDDLFNLVTSCKACNGVKRNLIPDDVEKKHLEWFIQGVISRKILGVSHLKISNVELDNRVRKVLKSYPSGAHTVFESEEDRFYVRDNKIDQIIKFSHITDD